MKFYRWLISIFSFNIYVFTILYCYISVSAVSSTQNCIFNLKTPGWTAPQGDITLKEGDDLEIYCLLDPEEAESKNYSSSQLYFVHATDNVNVRIPSENVSILNDTAVVLRLHNMSATNSWMHCKLDVNNSAGSLSSIEAPSHNETFICTNIVAVGKKPRDLENFSCYSYDWKELNCTWLEPDNEIRTTYSISYQLPKRGGRNTNYACPKVEYLPEKLKKDRVEYKQGRCSWTSETNPSYRNNFEFLTFVIYANNTIGNHTQTYKFHNYAHIIPSAPRKLEALEKTVSSVRLQWYIDSLVTFDKGWYYKVSYTWNSSGAWNVTEYFHKDKILEKRKDAIVLNVTGLKYPNTHYNFRVQMRSAVAPQNERWSEAAIIVVTTKPCPPYKPPKTDRSSFEVEYAGNLGTNRYVYVYWQPIPRLEYNGDNFTYDIVIFEDGTQINLAPNLLQNSYARYNISERSHKFIIHSKNAEGMSENASVVYVPSKDDILKVPIILSKVDYGNGVYELSWKSVDDVSHVNHTVFWCETIKDRPYQCDGFIDWKHVESGVSKFNFTIENYTDRHQSISYQFAVSAVTENSSSGMTWAPCTVLHNTVDKIKNVWIDKIDSYFMYIRWKLECSNHVGGIKGYYIYYCPMKSRDYKCTTNEEKSITIYGDWETDQANITELEPYKYYSISVAMFTNSTTGPRSEPIFNRTLDGPPDMTNIKPQVTAITNTSIALTWTKPNENSGILRRYLITFNDNLTEVSANATSTLLENLIGHQTYEIRLRACTILCSQPTEPIKVTTKIGKPGSIEGLSTQHLNATHMVVEWAKLAMPGGPSPVFKLRISYNDSSKVMDDWEVTGNYTVLDKDVCNYGDPSIQVRAINKDDKGSNQVYEGDWSRKLNLTCPFNQGSPVLKVMAAVAMLLVIASVSVTWGRKGLSRCQEMKNVSVTLPGPLNVPPFKRDSKDDFYEDFSLRTTKSVDEIRNLVDKTTELARDQDFVASEEGPLPWALPLIKESIF